MIKNKKTKVLEKTLEGSKEKKSLKKEIIEQSQKGFTLLEVLIVIGIVAILASVALVAINPSRQFKLARDSERLSNIHAIVDAIGQNMSEHKGVFVCNGVVKEFQAIRNRISSGLFDIYPCIVPDYLSVLPIDPNHPDSHYNDASDYDTGYDIALDENNRIAVYASGEMQNEIKAIR